MIDSIEKEIFDDLVCGSQLITVVEGSVFNKFVILIACGDDGGICSCWGWNP